MLHSRIKNLPHTPDGLCVICGERLNGVIYYCDGTNGRDCSAHSHWIDLAMNGPNQWNNHLFVVWNPAGPPTLKLEAPRCECGSEKCGLPIHSSWCPKAVRP